MSDETDPLNPDCGLRRPEKRSRRELGVLWVIILTFAMMAAEILAGYLTHSMALLADGWHMATHVGALAVTSIAYATARRYATARAFTFGTGKVHALGGFISALALGVVAVAMCVESVSRLVRPEIIDYGVSIPVAVVGLVVNLASVLLLHDRGHGHEHGHPHEHEHGHEHGHPAITPSSATQDHGHRAALMHVLADAFTSALAIAALCFGKWSNVTWMDPATGIVGALIIVKWGIDLARTTAFELLDLAPTTAHEDAILAYLKSRRELQVLDLHLWSVGRGKKSLILTLQVDEGFELMSLRKQLTLQFQLSHLTVELRKGPPITTA